MAPAQKVATIRIHEDVNDSYVESAVAHELAHLVLKDYTLLVGDIIAKLGVVAPGLLDTLGRYEERICEDIAYAVTGQPFQPIGKKQKRWHRPFDNPANKSAISDPQRQENHA